MESDKVIALAIFIVAAVMSHASWAADVAVVQSAAPTSNGGTQDLTSSGFGTPLCALFFGGYGTANGTAATHALITLGGSDFTRHNSSAMAAESGVNPMDIGSSADTTKAVQTLLNSSQAVDGSATAATITDGVRLTWADAPPSAYLINAVLFGGTNISNCYVGSFTGSSTQDATASTTAPNFQPDIIFFWTNNDDTSNFRASFGLAVNDGGSIVQRALGLSDGNNQASAVASAALRADRVTVHASANTLATLDITTIGTQGFTATTRDAAAARTVGYLALKLANGLRPKLLTCASPTAIGTHTCTGAGWSPQFGLMLHSESAAVGTYYGTDNGEVFGLSAFTASGSVSSATYHEDGAATSVTESM